MKRITFAFIFVFAACLVASHAMGDNTNIVVATNALPATVSLTAAQPPVVVDSIVSAFFAMLLFAGISKSNLVTIGIMLHFLAKYLTNYPMKNSTGPIANIISHLAIEGALDVPAAPVSTPVPTVTTPTPK